MPATASMDIQFANIRDLAGVGGANFVANSSTDYGNNAGWTINAASGIDLYWVGGTGNWSDPAHWSTTSGGSGGCVPTLNDNVFFDANSFSAPGQVVTLDVEGYCHDMDWTGSQFQPQLSSSSNHLNVYGSLTLEAGVDWSMTNQRHLRFRSTESGETLTSDGVEISCPIIFEGVGGEWTLQDEFLSASSVSLNNGSLITDDNDMTMTVFASTSSDVRSVDLGSSTITLTSYYTNQRISWHVSALNMTVVPGTSTINLIAAPSSVRFYGGSQPYHNIHFTSSSSSWSLYDVASADNILFDRAANVYTVSNVANALFHENAILHGTGDFGTATFNDNAEFRGANTFDTLNLTGTHTYEFSTTQTTTINEHLEANSTCTELIIMESNSAGNPAEISMPATATMDVFHVRITDLVGTGGANFIANSSTDFGGTSGWTVIEPASRDLYWVGGSGNWNDGNNWSLTSGGSGGECLPTVADNVFFDANSFVPGSQAVNVNGTAFCNSMDWTGSTNVPVITGTEDLFLRGSLIFVPNMTVTWTGSMNFNSRNTGNTVSLAGKIFEEDVYFNGVDGEWTLLDAFTVNDVVWLRNGTLNTNDQSINCARFESHVTTLRSLDLSSSTITLNGSGNVWNIDSTNVTLDAGTSTINFFGNTSTVRFYGGQQTYNDVNFQTAAAGVGTHGISDTENTFNDVNFTGPGSVAGNNRFNHLTFGGEGVVAGGDMANVITFFQDGRINSDMTTNGLELSAGYDYQIRYNDTITVNQYLYALGESGDPITLTSTSNGTQAFLKVLNDSVCADYLELQDINGTYGTAQLFAGDNGVDNGNNDGWEFRSCNCDVPEFNVVDTITICDGASFTFPDGTVQNNITTPVTYTSELNALSGCDSTIVTNLVIAPLYSLNETATVCFGYSYTFPDDSTVTNITSPMTYTSFLQSSAGCDSTVTTSISVLDNSSNSITVSTCDSYTSPSEAYTWTTTGIYQDTLVNSVGCDSVLTIDLTIFNSTSITITENACNSYTVPSGDETYTTSGIYTDTIPNAVGCDSIITIQLTTILDSNPDSIVAIACDSYTVPSGDETYTTSGIYMDTIPPGLTCDGDSIVVIDLTINNSSFEATSVGVCPGSDYTFPDGTVEENITSQVVYTSNLLTIHGCDSVIETTVYVLPIYLSITETDVVCNGDNYTFPDGTLQTNITSNTSYTSNLQTTSGCDSIVTTELTVLDHTTSSTVAFGCQSYTSPSGNYIWSVDGTYMDTIPNSVGCDSIMTIEVNIVPVVPQTLQIATCDSFTSPSGNYTWTTSGTYNDTTYSVTSCDTAYTIDLTILNPTSSSITELRCGSYTSPSGNYTWTTSGIYSDTIPNSAGCDSIVEILLYILPGPGQIGEDIDGVEGSSDFLGQYSSISSNGQLIAIGSRNFPTVEEGFVRIYEWDGESWSQLGDSIGGINGLASLSLSGDGNRLAIGATGEEVNIAQNRFAVGEVVVFERSGSSWTQMGNDLYLQYVLPINTYFGGYYDPVTLAARTTFGQSVSLSEDGSRLIAGDPEFDTPPSTSNQWSNEIPNINNGRVALYEWNGTTWVGTIMEGPLSTNLNTGGLFGYSVSISSDGTRAAIGAPNYRPSNNQFSGPRVGSVFVYERTSANPTDPWTQLGNRIDGVAQISNNFNVIGNKVQISGNGGRVVSGTFSYFDTNFETIGQVRVYGFNSTTSIWDPVGSPLFGIPDERLGNDFSISDDGNRLAVTNNSCPTTNVCAVDDYIRIYDWNGSSWTSPWNEVPWEGRVALSVSLSGDGNRFIGSHPSENSGVGRVRVYEFLSNTEATDTVEACASYTSPSGNYTWTASGTYLDTIPNVYGCDSVITTELTIIEEYLDTIVTGLCEGTYTSPSGNYTWSVSGVYSDTLTSVLGCDSIITVDLTIDSNTFELVTEPVCSGDDFTFPDGTVVQNVTSQVTHTSNLTSTYGCDSIIETTLEIYNTCPVPTGLTVSNIIADSALVAWSSVTEATGYIVHYAQVGETVMNEITVGAGTLQLALSGLDPCTEYYWNVQTICGSAPPACTTSGDQTFNSGEPNLALEGNGNAILNGSTTPSFTDSTDFGTTAISMPNANTFVITNTGTADLIVSDIMLSGTDAAQFSVSLGQADTIAIGESFSFEVVYDPISVGTHNATVEITSSDCDETVFTFAITGNATPEPAGSLKFDNIASGTDDNVGFSGPLLPTGAGDTWSLSIWVNPDSVNIGDNQLVFSQASSTGGFFPGIGSGSLRLYENDGVWKLHIQGSTTSSIEFGAAVAETWTNLAVTYDGVNLNCYQDGVLLSTTGALSSGIRNTSSSLSRPYGAINTFSTTELAGYYDELRVWDRALCGGEVIEYMNCELSGSESGLIHYYDFNQGFVGQNNSSVTTLIDRAGSIDGTLDQFALTGATGNWSSQYEQISGNCSFQIPTYQEAQLVDLCTGSDYTFPDGSTQTNITSQVVYTSNLQSVNGCDSVVETTLNVISSYDLSETVSVCSGESYTFPDGTTQSNITTQLVYTSNLQSLIGCDSIIETTVNINPTYDLSETVSVCSGESYTFPDGTTQSNITSQVVYTSDLQTTEGCDSIIETTVNVNPTYDLAESVGVCEGASYTFPDGTTQSNITAQVVYTSSLQTTEGCDSIIETTVNVNPTYVLAESNSVCSGESYTFPDGTTQSNITSQVVYTSNLQTTEGCDSIIETTVNVNPTYDLAESASVCEGESYTFPDGTTQSNITAQVVYTSSLQTTEGCDSIIETTVNVNPTYDLAESASVCEGGSFTFPDGTTQGNITTQVVYTSSLQTTEGCDSIIETTVNVNPTYDLAESVSVCEGESYTFPDGTTQSNITSQVVYTNNLQTTEGCDSIIETTVNVDPVYDLSESFTVCSGSSYTFPDGTVESNITSQVIHVSALQTVAGCDSIIETTVDAGSSYTSSESASVCSGSSYTFPDGTVETNITSQVVHVSSLVAVNQCDSIVTTTLDIDPTYDLSESVVVCEGESYTFPDGSTQSNITAQVVYTSNLQTTEGCDSIIETTVDVNPTYALAESVVVCEGESYTFPDGSTQSNITAQVVYTSNLQTTEGCDSIIETTVNVNPTYYFAESASVCEGESYTFPDGTTQSNITSQVVYTSNLQTTEGCDSIIETTVNVAPSYDLAESNSVCEGESYTFPDGTTQSNITAQVVYTSNLQTVHAGCDSIIETTVNVTPSYDLAESMSVCEGGSFTFPDGTTQSNITTQVVYTSSLQTTIGCDSIIETTVSISPSYDLSESLTVCSGSNYTFPDGTVETNITSQIIHVSNLQTALGCDSIIETTVDAGNGYATSESIDVCEGASYTFPDGTVETNITAQVIHVSLLEAVDQCDSTVTTTVNVTPLYDLSESVTICAGESYTFPDGTTQSNITSQVVYTSNLQTVHAGCDSIIETTVNVNPTYDLAESMSVCEGESYTFPDGSTQTITSLTVYTSDLQTTEGCDSIIETTVDVNPTYDLSESMSVCEGESYTFPDGSTQTITGLTVYTSSLQTTIGCDSIIETTVDVTPSYDLAEGMSVCSGTSYTFPDGSTQTITGLTVYTSNLQTTIGCDSIIETTVSVSPSYDLSEALTVCSGSSYTFPDGTVETNITSQIIHVSNLQTVLGCDSIIETTVDAGNAYATSESASVCEGESYTFPDGTVETNITAQVVHVSSFVAIDQCDSLVTTTVNVDPVYDLAESITVCEGETYTFPDGSTQIITAQTVYTSNLQTALAGCDSIIETTVNVNPSYDLSETVAICSGSSYTFPDGTVETNITSQIIHVSDLQTTLGCDSIIETTVDVGSGYATSASDNVCEGESYTFPDGTVETNITAQVVHVSNLVSIDQCDSIVTTTVDVAPAYYLAEPVTVCAGESYTFPDGTTQTISGTTVYTSSLQTTVGCDSIIETTVNVTPAYFSSETISVCEGESYTFPDGSTQTITGQTVYTSGLQTVVSGCDSLIETTVTISPSYNLSETQTVCSGSSYTFPDGSTQTITTQTVYTSSLQTAFGCDSIIETTVVPGGGYTSNESDLVCMGGSYTFPDGTTQSNITAQVVYVSNLVAIDQCDSIITTTVEVQSPYMVEVAVTVCEGDDYTFPDGTVETNITSQVIQTSNLQTALGCDSTVTTYVSVDNSSTFSITGPTNSTSYSLATYYINQPLGEYTLNWIIVNGDLMSNGSNFVNVEWGELGLGQVIAELTNGNCVLYDTLYVGAVGISEVETDSWSLFPNPSSGQFQLTTGNAKDRVDVYVYNALGALVHSEKAEHADQVTIDISHLANGSYAVSIVDEKGVFNRRVIKN